MAPLQPPAQGQQIDGVDMDEAEAIPVRRRRRRSSRRRAASWPEYWRSEEFGRHLFIAMCLIGAAYVGTIVYETRYFSRHYPPVKIGSSQSVVRYMLGAPDAIEAGGSVYRYTKPGREVTVHFSPAGRMDSISCVPAAPAPSTCPKILGLGIGNDEFDVLHRLGVPSRETFSGNDKTIHYDGMGLSFQFRQFKVTQLQLRAGGSAIGFFPHAMFAMIP